MKIKERALALLLSMVMVLTFMPALAFAEGEECEHDLDYVPGIEATCVDEGMEAHWQCSICGKFFRDSESGAVDTEAFDDETVFELPKDPTNHVCGLAHFEETPASCSEEGEKEHWYCEDCNRNYADAAGITELTDLVIPKTNHHEMGEHYAAREATIVNPGNIEYWTCCNCGHYFRDNQLTQEVDWKDVEIKKAAPNQDVLDSILDSDWDTFDMISDVWDAVEDAEQALNTGNVAAAISNANTAVSKAAVAKKEANAVMAKAKQYIADNAEELSDEDKEIILEWIQETVDSADSAAKDANTVLSKANAAQAATIEAARQGTYDPSLPKVKASKPKASKKAFTAKWKKLKKKQLKSGATNIEVWACADGAFAAGSTIERVVGKKKASTKIKGMAKGTYFVKVRAIKYVGGVKYVGPWSAVKKVKVKK